MKTKLVFALLVATLLSGCASGLIGSAATKIKATSKDGDALEITLPKEYEAKMLDLTFDPATKKLVLKADNLSASNNALVNSAARAQAEATSKAIDLTTRVVEKLAK